MSLSTVIDQMGREITLNHPPKRVISLVPSQTEYLVDIGVNVVGRTKFCIHPKEQLAKIPVIGGTKKFRFDVIKELQPDLIIGNKEENYKEGILELEKQFPVWMSDISTLQDAYGMMGSLGRLCNKKDEATKMIVGCRTALSKVYKKFSRKVVYLIWKDPWMAAGKNTFVDHMLDFLGYENLVTEERYPELSSAQISLLDPEYVLLSSEPYPFKSKHLESVESLWPNSTCQLVDGERYSWYGNRLLTWSDFQPSQLQPLE